MENTILDQMIKISEIEQADIEQHESIQGKDTPFRVEYRFPCGCKHYRYFCTYKEAIGYNYRKVTYPSIGITPSLQRPSSFQVQKKGVRGGWSKYKKETLNG